MKQILIFIVVMLFGGCQSPVIIELPPELAERGDSDSLQKALVIGNSDYDHSPLQNPVNDAKAITNELVRLGFHVTRATNFDDRRMKSVVKDFKGNLPQKGIAVFYFSGHGAQVDGINFLLPVNNKLIRKEQDLKEKAVSAQNVLAMMEDVNDGVNLLILDACRDNPYRGSEKSSSPGGLAAMKSPKGSLVAFATAPGQIALDGDEYNGLYTTHLLNALGNAKHQRIEDVFTVVQSPVVKESNGKQEPWYAASFNEPFCFGGCSSPVE